MKKTNPGKVAWYRISVIKAATLATLIMMVAYLVSLITVREVNRSLAQLAYDPEIEYSLTDYLAQIKENDQLKRDAVAFKLRQLISTPPTNKLNLRDLLVQSDIEDITDLSSLSIQATQTNQAENTPPITWLSRSQLRVYDWEVQAPPTKARQKFAYSQAIWQRYQLISSTWDEQIGPTFVAMQGLILAGSFLVLGLSLVLMARRYRSRIHLLLEGFSTWSERHQDFRFKAKELKSDELSLIAEQFNTMADEVEINRQRRLYLEKISSWQTIARKMAHEIKNPLTPIQMMVSHLERIDPGHDPQFSKTLHETNRIVTEEVSALRRMVDNFSEFAKLPSPTLQETDLIACVRHAFDLQKAMYTQHDLRFESKLRQAPCKIDPQQIRQVLINLIKNAAESKPEGLRIEVTIIELANHYEINVQDDGPGIDSEDLSRIFEAYFTTKHTGDQPGMGLGLAICKKIIFEHQGELSVTSQAGATRFQITLEKPEANS